jgi:epidermal growth factor receptor substrate 15
MPEQIERTPTPAVDDDVEPVKVLTAMGFSRGQAVAALEKYGYDVQLALNSLLAQSS